MRIISNGIHSSTEILFFNITVKKGWNTGNSYRVYATTPMLADVKAMDHIYGGETTSDGDTNYTFNNDLTRLQPLMMQTIIDSGGTDTLTSQIRQNSTLNLTGGH